MRAATSKVSDPEIRHAHFDAYEKMYDNRCQINDMNAEMKRKRAQNRLQIERL